MFRRLLMTLLIACLAAPAVAMPAEVTAATMKMSGCHGEAPAPDEDRDRGIADHGCIGCLAPFRVILLAQQPEQLAGLLLLSPGAAQRANQVAAPEPPPPRA